MPGPTTAGLPPAVPAPQGHAGLISRLHEAVQAHGTVRQVACLAQLAQAAQAVTQERCAVLNLTPYGLSHRDVPVPAGDGAVVPWLLGLFEEGVRELVLLPGLSQEELQAFLRVVAEPPPTGETRVGLAWTRQLPHLRLRISSLRGLALQADGADGLRLAWDAPEPDAGVGPAADCDVCRVPDAAAQAPPDHVAALRAAFSRELVPARLVALALDTAGGDQAPVLWASLDALLWTQDAEGLAGLLNGVCADHPAAAAQLGAELMSPSRLSAVAATFEGAPATLAPALLRLLGPDWPGLESLLGRLVEPAAREALVVAAQQAGHDAVPLQRRLLTGPDLGDALQALTALGASASPAALVALADALTHPVPAVREGALAALDGRWHEALRVPVGRALRDPSPEVRHAALQALRAAGDPRMTGALLGAAAGDAFPSWPEDDRRALLALLVELEQPRVRAWILTLMGRASLLSARGIGQTQLWVVMALSERATAWSGGLLSELRPRWNHAPLVRQALRAVHSR